MKRSGDILARLRAALIWVVLAPIRVYSRLISPALPARCKYYPTCSAYAQQALRRHGLLRGGALAAWRIMRCNPFSRGGVDDVPPPGRWRTPAEHGDAHDASQPHGSHA